MSTDILLALVNAVWGLVLAGIGIEMVNNPPDEPRKKRRYRALFVFLALAVIATTYIQAVRSEDAQKQAREEASRAKDQAHADQMANQTKLGYMKGTLDTIANFVTQYVAHPPASQSAKFDPSWALAILKMAQTNPGQSASTPPAQPSATTPPLRYQAPTISSVPPAFQDGQITGKDFGAAPGEVYLHPRVKGSGRRGIYAENTDNLLGGLSPSNYVPLPRDIVQKWSDTSLQLRFPNDYRRLLMSRIAGVARDRNVNPPPESDIEVCYQVRTSDGTTSNCLYAQ